MLPQIGAHDSEAMVMGTRAGIIDVLYDGRELVLTPAHIHCLPLA